MQVFRLGQKALGCVALTMGYRSLSTGAAVAALALAATTAAAKAADFTRIFSFEASDFTPTAPTSPVTGTILVKFGTDLTDPSAGITVESLNIPVDGTVGWSYSLGQDLVQIGGELSGINGIAPGSNDFDLAIYQATSPQPSAGFDFSDGNGAYRAGEPPRVCRRLICLGQAAMAG